MTRKQSKNVKPLKVPSKMQQEILLEDWQTDIYPSYLIEDTDGQPLARYADLTRARNRTKGTSHTIHYNAAAITKRGEEDVNLSRQSGNAITDALGMLVAGGIVLWCLLNIIYWLR